MASRLSIKTLALTGALAAAGMAQAQIEVPMAPDVPLPIAGEEASVHFGGRFLGSIFGSGFEALDFDERIVQARAIVRADLPYNLQFDVAVDFQSRFVDPERLFFTWQGPVNVFVGHYRPQVTIEERTSRANFLFVERTGFSDAADASRQWGVGVEKVGERFAIEQSVHRSALADAGTAAHFTAAGRAAYAPFLTEIVNSYVGFSWRYRRTTQDQDPFSYAASPGGIATLGPVIETPEVGEADFLFNGEAFFAFGPFAIQSEYGLIRPFNPLFVDPPTFRGGYVEVSWSPTGEARDFSLARGGGLRPEILRPLNAGGPGALRLFARYDALDLTDGEVVGGEQDAVSFGASWRPIDRFRVALVYAHASFTDLLGSEVPDANSIEALIQVEF
ncbi:MAG: porin [Maricaulaceae bacterium]